MEQFVEDSSLGDWKVIGSGVFGEIYKARHHQWGYDVAIKLPLQDKGTEKSLLHEIDMMCQATSPHVMSVRGIFKGRTPSGRSTQLGLVMEVMERGSLASLQEALRGTPPWPLVFRLAHQVALGINLLHSLPRPVLHQDLKPQNVVLDDALNAKLTDFGLARISCSITEVSNNGEPLGGTINYMPPEALKSTSYKPTRAFDIYSYGILLWSIVTGKQPYEYAKPEIVMLRVPLGDRPQLDDIKGDAAGLTELTGLMKRCWDHKPERRPRALECTTETEKLFKMHKHAINKAVYEVLMKLDQKEEEGMEEQVQRDQITEAPVEGIQQLLRGLNLLAGPQQRLDPLRVQRCDLMKYSCELTLDTNTVNRELKLSDNNRTVTWVREDQPYPDHPERFDSPQLLCRDGLTGRCYWEVERTGGKVSIAVSYRGIRRRGSSADCWFGRNNQSWRLWCSDGRYDVWHNNNRTSLPLSSSSVSRRVAVYVDCPAGSLSFYSVSSDSLIHLHTFNTTFTQPLYPGFAFGSYGSSMSLD
ncbi:receptor-interacting serine/threonine-protein kinase 3-like isoform X3 [Sander lucioperca]|uniref:receptor-interacting serine/threonine-protein kinase 3-like isoform X3 n=1 Tax=Sander lucioperca TaxID=283035 RepID=UPI0016537514|nr:receptor-interacting serine/threonine-protein kinase 3-like isoform X3 [Sander lucioperca]